jgi:hypothetical protein
MKQYLLVIFLFLVWTKSFCQNADSKTYVNPDYYYSKTDFAFADTLANWNYNLILFSENWGSDTILKPVGEITFFRTKALFDSISRRVYGIDWTPSIDFKIYNITDSARCLERSEFTRHISSCVPPAVGGDIFVVGNFIFLNNSVCLHCYKYDNDVDYCRPTIKNIFSKVRLDKVSNLREITQQFGIKQSKPN